MNLCSFGGGGQGEEGVYFDGQFASGLIEFYPIHWFGVCVVYNIHWLLQISLFLSFSKHVYNNMYFKSLELFVFFLCQTHICCFDQASGKGYVI